MGELFNAGDIVDKTLVATKKIPVYKQALDGAQIAGYVNPGQPVGVVYAWLSANPSQGRSSLWWSFFPVNGMYYYAPHIEGNFSVSALKQQGVISTDQKVKDEQEAKDKASRSWYENLIHDYGWMLLAGVGIATVPGIIRATR